MVAVFVEIYPLMQTGCGKGLPFTPNHGWYYIFGKEKKR
jgi:hypothetical protein